jgi:hypothetical protein
MDYFLGQHQRQHCEAMRISDWKSFQDATGQVSFPSGQRHGTVVHIDEETARSLWSQSPYNENSDRICAKIQEA